VQRTRANIRRHLATQRLPGDPTQQFILPRNKDHREHREVAHLKIAIIVLRPAEPGVLEKDVEEVGAHPANSRAREDEEAASDDEFHVLFDGSIVFIGIRNRVTD
jgi:hypothetical protein